ncbi:MAG: 6-bladed beta-propeller [Roseivirga sp.]|jgi:hypothetical protein|uniref:6-bladed beta-propeller n=1 Tax=Roseivirga sp. TaxID=1964215 RepID=UPI001B05A65C|nr:6-bladed beta-propeller [Roseivirga sp.]MBO6495126.1 6-bladed beta-propeller [Roseivirga sp.]
MHTQKSQVALLAIILFAFSCSSPENEESVSEQPLSSDEFISYKLTEGVSKVKWSDIIDEIQITRLEETEESLLSYVTDVHFNNKDQVVFSSGAESNIFTFSPTGELITFMNRKGEGPEEYDGLQGFWLEGDTVAVYSRGKYIKRYSLMGDFISSMDVGYEVDYMLSYSGGYALDMFFSVVDDSLFYNVLTLDNNLENRTLFFPSGPPKGFGIYTGNNTLARYKSSFIYQRTMSDTIYLHSGLEMKPFIHFDFGNDWFWKGKGTANYEDIDRMFESDLFWNQTAKVSPKLAYLLGWRGTGVGKKFLVDRVSHKLIELDESGNEEEKYGLTISHFVDNGVVGSMNSLEVTNLLNELEDNQWSFTQGTTLDIIESSENPVLLKIKFKDSSEW